jgi:hypothetical protein
MRDPFLIGTGVSDEEDAINETRKSTLQQRRNTVYRRPEVGKERRVFHVELARALRREAQRYMRPIPVSDAEHCAAIRRISEDLSTQFGEILKDGRFRYGTAQKALNLYLKFLWRLGLLGEGKPPHCPADYTVLQAAGSTGSWTESDDEQEYMLWIEGIRKMASPRDIADWEYETWRPQQPKAEPQRCA